jgi:hypothetical protein
VSSGDRIRAAGHLILDDDACVPCEAVGERTAHRAHADDADGGGTVGHGLSTG